VAITRRVERVVLISVDTLAAGHLPFYGYARDTAPRLARLAREGSVFDWAWSVGAHTEHGLRALFARRGPRPSLVQTLTAAGLSRTAVVPHAFDRYTAAFDRAHLVPGDDDARVVDTAIGEIEGGKMTAFTWIHLFAPHRPYSRHDGLGFGDRDVDLYDAEITYTDRAIGRVLDALDRAGLTDSTAIIVTADHGEEFGEHGGEAHGWDVFNELIRIPLVVRVPGAPPGRVRAHVTQRDVPPTVAELLGVAQPAGIKDRSLLPLVLGGPREDDRAVMSGPLSSFDAGAVMAGRWKLHFCLFNESRALYDLSADPGESLNLFEARPQIAELMEALLRRHLADPYNLGPPVTTQDADLGWTAVATAASHP
jgi:arylsulfatase A-like enzyme